MSVTLHTWVSIYHMIVFLLHKFKMMTSSDAVLGFPGFLRWGGGGQKMAQNDIKILSNSVSQKLYFIWLWLLAHMCKMMISSAIIFFFFKILIFQVFQSSSVNVKRKFWGVSHLLHMCVIFPEKINKIVHNLKVILRKPCWVSFIYGVTVSVAGEVRVLVTSK